MNARIVGVVALALLTACATRHDALIVPTPQDAALVDADAARITDCMLAMSIGMRGDSCSFTGECRRPSRPCCEDIYQCLDGVLRVTPDECDPRCTPCSRDWDCGMDGMCEGGRCASCPMLECEACPPELAPLRRGACWLCDCGPVSQCVGAAECMPPFDCIPGSICATGCTHPPDCCANVCAEPSCPAPAPEGCITDCETMCEGRCVAERCRCEMGVWRCESRCAGDYDARCFVPLR